MADLVAVVEDDLSRRERRMRCNRLGWLFLAFVLLAPGCRKKPTEATTPLHRAAAAGDTEQCRLLIAGGADVNAKDEYGRTPLHAASLAGHKRVAEMLLAGGADVKAEKSWDDTPLHYAARCGHKDIVELLVTNGADINVANWQEVTPLGYAVGNAHGDMVALLAASGADVNAENEDGWTALHTAARQGHKEIVQLLIDYGSNLDCTDERGRTPAIVAMEADHREIAKLFIAAGAFHASKPSDLIPELQGRFPIRVELSDLTSDDFVRILTEPKNALVKQYEQLMSLEGVTLKFEEEALREVVKLAVTRKTGARSLRAIMENVMLDIMYNVPSIPNLKTITITPEVVTKNKEPKFEFSSTKQSA